MNLAAATLAASPIGVIPVDYPQHTRLCHAANIRYRDETSDHHAVRTWKVIRDKDGTVLGHTKFCKVLDAIRHDHPEFTTAQVYDAILDDPHYKLMLSMNWIDLHNKLAGLGVHGYELIKSKRNKQFEQFSDVLE